jgi:hypothetical protein
MTDQQVLDIIRRRMAGITNELLVDPQVTPAQFAACMAEVALEQMSSFVPKVAPAVASVSEEQPAAGAAEARDALGRLGKALDKLSTAETPAVAPHEATTPAAQAARPASRA